VTITAVTPVSPIPAHPDTAILDETVESVRHFLPDVEIFLCFDGVRDAQADRKADYEEAVRRILWKADHDPLWRPVCPFVFDSHLHQVGMMRAVIDEIRTPLLMYVESDTPLLTDRDIDFDKIAAFLTAGRSDLVRLFHEEVVPYDHQHLYFGHEDGFLRTSQWSARPHVATVDYYRRILRDHFTENANSYLEDRVHTFAQQAYRDRGIEGWRREHCLHVYDPHGDGQNMRRSGHLNGRGNAPKFETEQVF
jgi:hypothetical protein